MNYEMRDGLFARDVLFIHGNLASNAWWRPSLDVWSEQRTPGLRGNAICAEWRGCGRSAAPTTGRELHPEALADDYIALLRELGVERVHVVGHSTGGLIALFAMAKAPELFARAVLLDPVSLKGIALAPEIQAAFAEMAKNRDFCATVMATTIHQVDPHDAFFVELVDDAFHVADLVWTEIPKILSQLQIRDKSSAITHPTLVLHGELDPILPIADSIELASELPNGRFCELRGRGHSTNIEDPQLFVRQVNGHFFRKFNQDPPVNNLN